MKLQVNVSKIICYAVLIISIICFVFSLGITTDIYNLYLLSSFNVSGSEIYEDIQYFNKTIVNMIIIAIILACTLFITRTHIRKRYYISNYVNVVIVSLYNIVVSFIAIFNLIYFRDYFINNVDFIEYKKWTEVFKSVRYSESTFWFDINIVSYIVLIVISIILFINLLLKNKKVKQVTYEK